MSITSLQTLTIMALMHIIYPLGGLWITALGFQMINNGVHWASDYPLGIGMGYLIDKLSTQMGKTDQDGTHDKTTDWMILPTPRGILASKAF